MDRKATADRLSKADLFELLRRRKDPFKDKRLEYYRKTGRIISVVPDYISSTTDLENTLTTVFQEESEKKSSRISFSDFINRSLKLLEISAVLGLFILVGYNGLALSNLNQQSVKAWVQPSPTPLPLIRAVVLPEGHTPPNAAGETRPRDEEIPTHLRPLVQSYANIPIPTAAPQHGVRIQIPALKIDAPIIQGDGWEQLKKGVAQHIGTANPGQNGNMVLSGHNDVYGEVFRYLDRLKPGDTIVVFTSARSYTYVVTRWFLVEPTQVEVMDPTPDSTLTLISCYPYLVDTQRIIVKAQLSKDIANQ